MKTYADSILAMARSQLGVTESPPGSNRGPQVQQYQAVTTLGGTGWPWCAAFVAWCYKHGGLPLEYPSASTVEFLRWARQHGDVLAKPQPGMIVEFDFPGGDEVDHTGIVESVRPTGVTTIEGNTSSGVTGSQSNGGGVFRRYRPYASCKAFIRIPGLYAPLPVKKRIAGKVFVIRQKLDRKRNRWYTDVEPK